MGKDSVKDKYGELEFSTVENKNFVKIFSRSRHWLSCNQDCHGYNIFLKQICDEEGLRNLVTVHGFADTNQKQEPSGALVLELVEGSRPNFHITTKTL